MKEKILEIDFIEVFGYAHAWQITKNKIKEKEIDHCGIKIIDGNIYFLNKFEKEWERKSSMTLLSGREKRDLENFVCYVNEYCNKQRWRAEKGDVYYFVNYNCEIFEANEWLYPSDNLRYELGNYFETREEAKKISEKLRGFWKTIKEEEEK